MKKLSKRRQGHGTHVTPNAAYFAYRGAELDRRKAFRKAQVQKLTKPDIAALKAAALERDRKATKRVAAWTGLRA